MEHDLALGDVNIWQEWYTDRDINVEGKVACLYQLQQPRDGQLENAIRSFHSHHGHTINVGTKIITGLGSTQVMLGLIYAFANSISKPKYTEQVPHCMLHENLVNILGQEWIKVPTKKDPPIQPTIEFVTSPNNPDGSIRVPRSSASIILWDAVYAWPWYGFTLMNLLTHMKKACTKRLCIPIFSFSKSIGLAGQRVGYALIPPSVQKEYPGLLDLYHYYITTTTLGTCRPGEGVCRVIASSYREFPTITETLENRYDLLSSYLSKLIPTIEILSPKGFAYMWLKCPGVDLYDKLLSFGIRGTPGADFNSSSNHLRLNLLVPTSTFDSILK